MSEKPWKYVFPRFFDDKIVKFFQKN